MLSIERAGADKDVERCKRTQQRMTGRDRELARFWSHAVIKEICFFRPACVSAEAFALQQNATVGWRG